VTEVGEQIFENMTARLRLHIPLEIAKDYTEKVSMYIAEMDKEIGEIYKNAESKADSENEILKSLKKLFITKVDTLKMSGKYYYLHLYTYRMQRVATEIYKNCEREDAEKQLAFFLDLFVANLEYIDGILGDKMFVVSKWQMRMTIEP
jgi:predicted transcriptional regulator